MKAVIFDIQRFSIHDGPGIRTNVFMKGCPLSCVWCHNPESQSVKKQLAFYANKCVSCGACTSVCDNHKIVDGKIERDLSACRFCGKCVEACVGGALEIIGREEDTEDIIKEVLKDKNFYETSGGGITLSGGEPLYQVDATVEILKRAKQEGLNTAIETCGFASADAIKRVSEFVDLFLYDFKESDEEKHIKFTGQSNARIIENLLLIDSLGKKSVLRCPIIPTLNDTVEHFEGIARLAVKLENLTAVEVMAFHRLGFSKYDALRKENELKDLEMMEKDKKQECINAIKAEIKKLTDKEIAVI